PDKAGPKRRPAEAGLPVPEFAPVESPADLAVLGARLGWPLVLKTRREGYDGKGNRLVESARHAEAACHALGWPERHLYAERFLDFRSELAVLVVRARDGATT